jgi:membrane protein required for colicin V production
MSVGDYNLIDLFIIGTLLITVILGTWKGLVKTFTALAGLVLGVALALHYYPVVQLQLKKISSLDPQVSMILSMIVIFIGVQLAFVALRRILDAILDVTRLSWLDRSFGLLLGLCGGFIIVAAAVQVLVVGIPEWPEVKKSQLVKPVQQLTAMILTHAPKQVRDQFSSLTSMLKSPQEPPPSSARGSDGAAPQPRSEAPGASRKE